MSHSLRWDDVLSLATSLGLRVVHGPSGWSRISEFPKNKGVKYGPKVVGSLI